MSKMSNGDMVGSEGGYQRGIRDHGIVCVTENIIQLGKKVQAQHE